ncbi:MAG: SDR family NAD(P)-dependent oxidoreductase [Acidobacteria bacterium]|nr:MAG: SDR family NAD(P)-dependent oxidoreductase [Acidobacteriota bacterium]REK11681.1 MAG: SDR family NAD(P)-dependent oxidoreductase [Acidobacteriota bacterium]
MRVEGKVVVVTGGGSGIGEGLVERFVADGARHVVVLDRDGDQARRVADRVGARTSAAAVDVADEDAVRELVAATSRDHGPIDLFVSNAGYVTTGGLEIDNAELQGMWEVHVLSHLYAARAVLPSMIERGGGYLLNTASAAGLLTQIGSLAYSVTKHAAVALSEWLAITHHHQGIRVSVLCPQAVATNIIGNSPTPRRMDGPGVASGDGVLSKEDVAQCVTEALAEERFWVLPHPEVAEYARRKGSDIDRWLAGMRRFQERLYEGRPLPGDWLIGRSEGDG